MENNRNSTHRLTGTVYEAPTADRTYGVVKTDAPELEGMFIFVPWRVVYESGIPSLRTGQRCVLEMKDTPLGINLATRIELTDVSPV